MGSTGDRQADLQPTASRSDAAHSRAVSAHAIGAREFDVSDVEYAPAGLLPAPRASFVVSDGVVHEVLR